MIHQSSRYRRKDAYVTQDSARSTTPLEGVQPHEQEALDVRRTHQVQGGERLDLLAQRFYGDPLKFWLICDADDAIFPDELMLEGRILRIPRNRLL